VLPWQTPHEPVYASRPAASARGFWACGFWASFAAVYTESLFLFLVATFGGITTVVGALFAGHRA